MLLRYEQIGTWEVDDYRAWRSSAIGAVLGESTGEEGEYLCTDRRWERIGGVRKRTDVPLQ
jgi:hypothetical protein